MITLEAKIQLTESNSGLIESVSTNISNNSISKDISNVVGKRIPNTVPFILGTSTLNNGYTLESEVDFYIGDEVSNTNGIFENPYVITITGSQLTDINICFDTNKNQHPTLISVDGKIYQNDDSIFAVRLNQSSIHTITIDNWNAPNYPLIISGIYLNFDIAVNYRNLISISQSIFDRGDTSYANWGVFSNAGNLQFNDIDGEIKDYAQQGILKDGAIVLVELHNDLDNYVKKLGEYYAKNWNYDENNKSVSVSLTDGLEDWQSINVPEVTYDFKKYATSGQIAYAVTAKVFYEILHQYSNTSKIKMASFEELDGETRNAIISTIIPYPYLRAGTLWTQWQKLCDLCQLHIFKNYDGIIICKYKGGN